MTTTPAHVLQADAQLYALTQALSARGGITAELVGNELHVEGQRSETITCSPRPSDGDRLWFWDSKRQPIGEAEADKIADVALTVAKDVL